MNDFSYEILDLSRFNELINLVSDVYSKMPRKEFWGGLDENELRILFNKPNYVLGAFHNNKLIAFMSSYNPNINDLKDYGMDDFNPDDFIFLHGVMVHDEYRGNHLQEILGNKICEMTDKKYVLATVHPENIASIKSLEKIGLKIYKTMNVPYGYRHIMIKE